MTLPETTAPQEGGLLPPSAYVPPPSPATRRRWAVGEIICWCLVVILCGTAAVMAMAEHSTDDDHSNVTLGFISRYVVGVHEINKGGALGGVAAEAKMLQEVEKAATSPEDRLRYAIVQGEFQGHEKALGTLADLARDHPEMETDVATACQLLTDQMPPSEKLDAFRIQYGWFTDLAQSVDKPAGDPLRARTIHGALVTMGGYIAVLAALLAVVGVGVILLIIAIVLMSKGKVRLRFNRGAPGVLGASDRRAYLQGFSIYMAGIVVLSGMVELGVARNLPRTTIVILALIQLAGFVVAFAAGIVWPLWRERRFTAWRVALGLHVGRGFFREVGSGILGYLTGVPIMAAGYLVTVFLASVTGLKPTHPIENSLNGSVAALVFVFVLACVWAPITEELMFRGALFAHLRERFGWWISAPVVAVVFAIIHPQGWVALPALGAIAFVFAGIREWRGSIIGCMTAHAIHNACSLAMALLFLRAV